MWGLKARLEGRGPAYALLLDPAQAMQFCVAKGTTVGLSSPGF